MIRIIATPTTGATLNDCLSRAITLCKELHGHQANTLADVRELLTSRKEEHFLSLQVCEGDGSTDLTTSFTLESVEVAVCHDSILGVIMRDFKRAQDGCIEKSVGSHPSPVLTLEERRNDLRQRELS